MPTAPEKPVKLRFGRLPRVGDDGEVCFSLVRRRKRGFPYPKSQAELRKLRWGWRQRLITKASKSRRRPDPKSTDELLLF